MVALLNLSGPVAKISVDVPSTAFAAPFSTLTVGIDVGWRHANGNAGDTYTRLSPFICRRMIYR